MFFLTLTNGVDPHVRSAMANRIGLYSLIVLVVCLFAGNIILNFFGISIGVLRMAGGIVLFSAGWQALNAPAQEDGAPSAGSLDDGFLSVYVAVDNRPGGHFRCRSPRCDSL